MAVTAILITIGDELLIGQVIDTNSAWMAQQLNAAGIRVTRRIAIGDDREAILSALNEALKSAGIVLITGGLGPTADDITKPVLTEYFGGPLVIDKGVLAQVTAFFEKRNRPLLDRNRRQAEVPQSCTVLPNAMGTAPGMWFEKEGKIIVSLPGVPYEMQHLMETGVLPRLKERFGNLRPVLHRNLLTAGEGESFVAEQIADLESALPPTIKLAYLPSPGFLRLRLTAENEGEGNALEQEIDRHRDALAQRLAAYMVSQEDQTLQQILAALLVEKELWLSLAESCTAGYIAHLLTQIPGTSKHLRGGLVCYHPDLKKELLHVPSSLIEKEGIVSEAVAEAMARGVLQTLRGDMGFGITGYLDGAGDDKVPAGTVCMAAVQGEKKLVKTFRFHLDRQRNKDLAAQNALLLMIRFLKDDSAASCIS